MAAPRLMTEHFQIRVRPQTLAFWRAVAAREGISVSQLVRQAADQYAKRRLSEQSMDDVPGIHS